MNRGTSNKYTKNVINKSIELILLGENIKNRSISKLLNIADQQSFYISAVKETLYSSTLNFENIY